MLPTGTITFLFTDIQGSTPLWEREPEKMAAALQVHNAALRRAIESNGGVVFKVVGDAFNAAFSTAPQALKAAIDGQRALESAPWNELGPLKVRMGIHTGEAELDPDGDEYAVSHTKNRVSRIMSAGHGGQILLSEETADLVRRKLPEGVTLKDLGEQRLKGMEWLENLYQVCAPGLPQDFPPLVTAITHPNNLPVELTSFIGRSDEIAHLSNWIAQGSHRLVTLTGSGGTGKTRLALRVGTEALTVFPDGVWLVELAPLADPGLVAKTTAQALGLQEVSGTLIETVLSGYLHNKRPLLILDNCEHLLEECSRLADLLLKKCPHLHLLATSREILGVAGETPFHVPSLAAPDPKHLPDLEQVACFDAVRLFLERAEQAAPGFAEWSQRRGGGDHLLAAGRHPAGHRAGGGPGAGDGSAADRRPAGQPLPPADWRQPQRAAPPADTQGHHRLELRPALRAGTAGAATAFGLRRGLDARGRRGRRWRGRYPAVRGVGRAHQPGGQIVDSNRHFLGRLDALPHVGDGTPVCP